uniref:Fibronectin type-III domain-containing protein n=1 Tax=Globisporangium ultimum (strain ATCC 200006 / CBS 805.95 / DAOM BR144) TaxID=431595 RepID=K3X416_GLOUD
MSVEVDAINGNLRGIVLPNSKLGRVFVDSPELQVEVGADERDHLVFRMKYVGQCDLGMVSLERNAKEPSVDPGPRRERTVFHDPVDIPFNVRGNGVDSDLYYVPIWKHVSGTIHRVRFYPCIVSPKVMDQTSSQQFGQTFHIDWIAFTKAPVITKVRGCIDRYYQENDDTAVMNCTEHPRFTNGYHHNTAFECFPMALPIASTYNCMRDGGGHRIAISGKHFGKSDAIVTIDGVECLEVVHVVPETELECLLPPASSQWLAAPVYPSKVRVQNGQLHDLADEVALLSYAAPVRALPIPIISNVAAHALDVNWVAPSDIWEAMTVTGYRVRWKKCTDAGYSEANAVILGNVTSTTLIVLERNTSYQVQVTALTEDYRDWQQWQDLDLYGRRAMLENAVLGLESPSSTCKTTLAVGKVSNNGVDKTKVRL